MFEFFRMLEINQIWNKWFRNRCTLINTYKSVFPNLPPFRIPFFKRFESTQTKKFQACYISIFAFYNIEKSNYSNRNFCKWWQGSHSCHWNCIYLWPKVGDIRVNAVHINLVAIGRQRRHYRPQCLLWHKIPSSIYLAQHIQYWLFIEVDTSKLSVYIRHGS